MTDPVQNEFDNLRQVAAYLQEQEWKVSQSTVYKHAREGRLRPTAGGTYPVRVVDKYATTHLVQKETGDKVKASALQEDKTRAEVEKLQEQALHAKIRRMALEGKYVLRDQVELELAGRAATLAAGLNFFAQARAGEIVDLVEGNPARTGDLVRELTAAFDEFLNEYATTKGFEVSFGAGAQEAREENYG
jgi:hypothetical protein